MGIILFSIAIFIGMLIPCMLVARKSYEKEKEISGIFLDLSRNILGDSEGAEDILDERKKTYAKNNKDLFISELICGVLLSLFTAIVAFAATLPGYTKISATDYIKAMGAQVVLADTTSTNIVKTEAMDIINKYHDKRTKIDNNHNRFWDGIYYAPETLFEYPDVTVDNE